MSRISWAARVNPSNQTFADRVGQSMSAVGAAAVVGAAASTRYGGKIALCGDSITANWQNVSLPATNETRGNGYISWAKALCGQRVSIIYSGAVGGAYITNAGSVTPVVTQVGAAVLTEAAEVIVQGGVNDITNGVELSVIKSTLLLMYGKIVAAGKRCRAVTIPPIGASHVSYSVARQAKILELNRWIRELARTGVLGSLFAVTDLYSAAVNPDSATSDYISTYDNLHPSNSAAYKMGKLLAEDWTAMYPAVPFLPSSNADNYGYDSSIRNILDNGLFVAGSGTATGFTASVSGAAHTPSLVTHAGGFGKYQRLVATSSAAGQFSRIATGDLKARVTTGNSYIAVCEVVLSSITNLRTVRLSLSCTAPGGNIAVADFQTDGTNDVALPEAFSATLVTPVMQTYADQGALTSFSANVTQFFSGTGGATLDIGRMAIIDVS